MLETKVRLEFFKFFYDAAHSHFRAWFSVRVADLAVTDR